MLESLLDPVFRPLLGLGSFAAILIITLIITVITTLIYKYTTDQALMKRSKADMKNLQKKLKASKDDPKKMMAIQREMMEKNMALMKNSFKPMLYTFIPLIIIFGWLNANLSFLPLMPATPFNITAEFNNGASGSANLEVIPELELLSQKTQEISPAGAVVWGVRGEAGEYTARIYSDSFSYDKDFIISERKSSAPQKIFKNEVIKSITLSNNKLTPLGSHFSIFGWKPGWLALYIIFSIIFSMGLRKLLNIG